MYSLFTPFYSIRSAVRIHSDCQNSRLVTVLQTLPSRYALSFAPITGSVLAFLLPTSNAEGMVLQRISLPRMNQAGKSPCMSTAWHRRIAQGTNCTAALDRASPFFHSFPNLDFSQICTSSVSVSPHMHQQGNEQRNLSYDRAPCQGRRK